MPQNKKISQCDIISCKFNFILTATLYLTISHNFLCSFSHLAFFILYSEVENASKATWLVGVSLLNVLVKVTHHCSELNTFVLKISTEDIKTKSANSVSAYLYYK